MNNVCGGDVTFLICHVTSRDLLREGSFDLMGESLSPLVTALPEFSVMNLVVSNWLRDIKRPYD